MTKDQHLQPGRPQEASQMYFSPGLNILPRQIGRFPAFRAVLLEDASREPGLSNGWRGRESEDFGVMLLEMFAYIADVLTFYDEQIAGEAYLRPAVQRPSLRRLTGLIGYLPRPATAARVTLALALDGRLPVTIPAGTAFRSSAFADEKPQVFVTTIAASLHPLRDQFTLQPQPSSKITVNGATATFQRGSVRAKIDDGVIVQSGSAKRTRHVTSIEDVNDDGGYPVTRVTFNQTVPFLNDDAASAVKLLRHGATANIYIITYTGSKLDRLQLDGVYKSIKIGDVIMLGKGAYLRWYTVTSIVEYTRTLKSASTIDIKNASNVVTSRVTTPAVTTVMTELKIDVDVNTNATGRRMDGDTTAWGSDSGSNYTVYYGFTSAGTGQGEASETISDSDTLKVKERVEAVAAAYVPSAFIVRDLNETAVALGGSLNTSGTLTLDSSSGWDGDLLTPVTLYGALVEAERGEQVTREVLGIGDASTPNQSFTLKKFPLTFVDAPSSTSTTGVASTLVLTVNNIRWYEVERFYGRRADETIFIVRADEAGKATITFGDGVRGARVPSGALIVASYRFGAGAAAPPARSITQVVTPVKGVTGQRNPLAAYGGSDAETEDGLKTYAPKSALMFGRAVSLVDYEASVASTSGVSAARASWSWSQTQQRPVVQIAYIGVPALGATILERLSAISAVGVPIAVTAATPLALTVLVTLEIDPAYVETAVIASVTSALQAALLPEILGIGAILFRSTILAVAASIDGVTAPTGVFIDGSTFAQAGIRAGMDEYFEITVMVEG